MSRPTQKAPADTLWRTLLFIVGIATVAGFTLVITSVGSQVRKDEARQKRCTATVAKLDAFRAEGKKQFCSATPVPPKCEAVERDLLEHVVQACRRK